MAVNHAGNRGFLVEWPEQFKMGQIEPHIELKLGIAWLHMSAEAVKGLVVILLFEVRQFVDNNHP